MFPKNKIFDDKWRKAFGDKTQIHNPDYLTWWESSDHLNKRVAYENDWTNFFRNYPDASKQDILNYGRQLAQKYGLTIHF